MAEEKLLTQTTQTHSAKTTTAVKPRPSVYSSALAIIGFIILIVIVLWGLFHIASLTSPFFASLFNGNGSGTIQVTAPTSIKSGESFALRWKYSPKENGMYALLYQCKDNFHFEIPRGEGASTSVPCGTAYGVPASNNADNMISITPMLSGSASTSIPVSLIFMPSATSSKQAQGSASIMVVPSGVPVVQVPDPVTPAPTSPVTTQPRPTSRADLSVQILGVSVDPSGMAVVEFDIANIGGSASGSYYFQAFLPTQSVYTYTSPLQSSLGAGAHMVNTLRFSQGISGTISIVVDHTDSVSESNENNNYASQSTYSYMPTQNYMQQYPYQQQYYSQPYLPAQAGQYPYVY